MTNHDGKEFFHTFQKYVCDDIKELMKLHERPGGFVAGPLLVTTLNGIDVMGGMIDGFDTGVGTRSKSYLETHMKIPKELAELAYYALRCGMVHEGNVKGPVVFRVPGNTRLQNSKKVFYRGEVDDPVEQRRIGIDVYAFAKAFLESVGSFAANLPTTIYTPVQNPDPFENAFTEKKYEWGSLVEFESLLSDPHTGFSGYDPNSTAYPNAKTRGK